MNITKIIKNIPKVKKFINTHNPRLQYLLQNIGFYNNKKKLIIDIGANTGQTIDWCLQNFQSPIIYSFEPTEELVSILKIKYQNNKNVKIHPVALSNYSGEGELFTSDYSPTNSLLKPDVKVYEKFSNSLSVTLKHIKTQIVKVDTFDNWYTSNMNNEVIDLLKSDTQGNEFNVISGGINTIKNKVKTIIFELQFHNFYENAVPFYKSFELLYESNFYLFSFFENNRLGNLQLLESNVLFLNKKFYKEALI